MNAKSCPGNKAVKEKALTHLGSLLRTALYMTADETKARDVAQKTYSRAYRQYRNEPDADKFRAGLFKTLTEVLHEFKTFNDLSTEDHTMPDNRPFSAKIPKDKASGKDAFEFCSAIDEYAIRETIHHLPVELRYVVILSFLEGFSYREIAEITGKELKRVKSDLVSGRQLLQNLLWQRMIREGLISEYSAYC